jgi:hypothetical protein
LSPHSCGSVSKYAGTCGTREVVQHDDLLPTDWFLEGGKKKKAKINLVAMSMLD